MEDEAGAPGGSQSATDGERQKRESSTIAFPYTDLNDAVAIARAIWENVGTSTCDLPQLAAWAGHDSVESGSFRQRMSGARLFGLVTSGSRQVALTDLGRAIVDPDRAAQARVESFLTVPLYRRLFERYEGTNLPTTNVALEADLVNLGVSEKQRDRSRQVFQRSAEQAGLFGQGRNRLVRPAIRQEDGHREEREQQGVDAKGGGTGDLPAYVQLLISSLPKPGTVWSQTARQKWLKLATATFDVVYEDEPATDRSVDGPSS